MKKIIYTAIISLGVLVTSCDYVANPYPEKNANVSSDTVNCIDTFPAMTSHIKKILIEDYTGHTCPNCPRAARAIEQLDTTYPGKIVALAIHAGTTFAPPAPGHGGTPSTSFLNDFRTTAGNTLDNFFGASAYGLPAGTFNRKFFNPPATTHLIFYANFQTTYSSIAAEPSVVDLQVNVNYDPATRKICCAVRDSFLTPVTGAYRLSVFISQDNIIGWQDDLDANPEMDPNYVFNHMLRDAITPTGVWGESLIGSSAPAGLTQVRHFAYTIPSEYYAPGSTINPTVCNVNDCHIVALIYNTATSEVIQSEDVKVIP